MIEQETVAEHIRNALALLDLADHHDTIAREGGEVSSRLLSGSVYRALCNRLNAALAVVERPAPSANAVLVDWTDSRSGAVGERMRRGEL